MYFPRTDDGVRPVRRPVVYEVSPQQANHIRRMYLLLQKGKKRYDQITARKGNRK